MKTFSLILALSLGLSGFVIAAAPVYETTREFTASGDFNGDGTQDVIIIDKPTGLYRIGIRSAAATPTFAASRPTGAANLACASLGKLNGTAADSFAVSSLTLNRVQVLSPSGTGYTEPRSIFNAGVSPQTMCAIDITSGASPTPEDDLALVVGDDPTLQSAIREIRSNAGAWSIIDIGDCPEGFAREGNPLQTSVGGTALFGFMRDKVFNAVDPNGALFTQVLTSGTLAAGSRFISLPFEAPNMDLVFYAPGSAEVHVRRITASGPGWVLGSDDITTFSASIAQIIPVQDVSGMRMLVRFDNGSLALYSYTLATGFGSPTAIVPTGATGVISGLVPISGSAGFLAFYASAEGQPSSTAVSFANSGTGWAQTGITTLPTVSSYSSYANILLLSNFPFREDNPLLLRSYHSGDWSTSVTVGGGPFNVNAQVASYLGQSTGIGNSSAQTVGVATAAPTGTAVNQLHPQFSLTSFDSKLGDPIEDVTVSPVAGTYDKSIQLTFSGYSGGSNVLYRFGTSGAFSTYNPSSPPWVFTDGSVQYYSNKPGTGSTPTHSAAYHFTVPPALQDKDGDGVPDFVEVANGLNPEGGPDSDNDGHSDRNELAANTNPNNPTSYPANAAMLSTLLIDAGFRSETTAGASTGYGQSGTTFTVTDFAGRQFGSHHDATLMKDIQGGEVGLGAASSSYGRVNVLNATGDIGFVVVRSQQNYGVIPSTGVEPRGREKIGLVPTPDIDGWSFGSTEGSLVTTGTTYSWGGINWQRGSNNWDAIDDSQGFDNGWSSSQQSLTFSLTAANTAAAAWKSSFVPAANRNGQPYAQISVTPVTTLHALIVSRALRSYFTARGYTPTSPDGVIIDATSVGKLTDLRYQDPQNPDASKVRIATVLSTVEAELNSSDTGALALRKLARDAYARHESLATDHLGDMPTPLKALNAWVNTGALPAEYQTGSSLTPTELTDAASKLTAILAAITTRPQSTQTLYVRSSASPIGLTLLQDLSGTTTYALVDGDHKPTLLPSDISLPAGTPLTVTAYTDLPNIAGYIALEVIEASLLSLPNTIDPDSDGDLLADNWELHHFGSLDMDTYSILDGGLYTAAEEYFRSTDPRWSGSAPAGPPTPLAFTSLTLVNGILTTTWPSAYSGVINVDFQASDDLLNWAVPIGFNATHAGGGVFIKSVTYDRAPRFFRPLATLKR
jgi:hypothetical protein